MYRKRLRVNSELLAEFFSVHFLGAPVAWIVFCVENVPGYENAGCRLFQVRLISSREKSSAKLYSFLAYVTRDSKFVQSVLARFPAI